MDPMNYYYPPGAPTTPNIGNAYDGGGYDQVAAWPYGAQMGFPIPPSGYNFSSAYASSQLVPQWTAVSTASYCPLQPEFIPQQPTSNYDYSCTASTTPLAQPAQPYQPQWPQPQHQEWPQPLSPPSYLLPQQQQQQLQEPTTTTATTYEFPAGYMLLCPPPSAPLLLQQQQPEQSQQPAPPTPSTPTSASGASMTSYQEDEAQLEATIDEYLSHETDQGDRTSPMLDDQELVLIEEYKVFMSMYKDNPESMKKIAEMYNATPTTDEKKRPSSLDVTTSPPITSPPSHPYDEIRFPSPPPTPATPTTPKTNRSLVLPRPHSHSPSSSSSSSSSSIGSGVSNNNNNNKKKKKKNYTKNQMIIAHLVRRMKQSGVPIGLINAFENMAKTAVGATKLTDANSEAEAEAEHKHHMRKKLSRTWSRISWKR